MVRWLERQGYDVTYSTDLDTHSRADFWKGHRAWLSVSHDEYWSQDIWRHVEKARDQGWPWIFLREYLLLQIRLEPSLIYGRAEPDHGQLGSGPAGRSPGPGRRSIERPSDHSAVAGAARQSSRTSSAGRHV